MGIGCGTVGKARLLGPESQAYGYSSIQEDVRIHVGIARPAVRVWFVLPLAGPRVSVLSPVLSPGHPILTCLTLTVDGQPVL